jgi:hypothetical protein
MAARFHNGLKAPLAMTKAGEVVKAAAKVANGRFIRYWSENPGSCSKMTGMLGQDARPDIGAYNFLMIHSCSAGHGRKGSGLFDFWLRLGSHRSKQTYSFTKASPETKNPRSERLQYFLKCSGL